jgi:hypothetical protein
MDLRHGMEAASILHIMDVTMGMVMGVASDMAMAGCLVVSVFPWERVVMDAAGIVDGIAPIGIPPGTCRTPGIPSRIQGTQ